MQDFLVGLSDKSKLIRERSLTKLKQKIKEENEKNETIIEDLLKNILKNESSKELIESLLIIAAYVVPLMGDENENNSLFNFYNSLLPKLKSLLTHQDVKIRTINAELIKIFSEHLGIIVFSHFKEILITLIQDNLDQKTEEPQKIVIENNHSKDQHNHCDHQHNQNDHHHHHQKKTKINYNGKKQTNLMHDTEGFGPLVSSLKVLEYLVEGCSKKSDPNSIEFQMMDEKIIELLKYCTMHKNRFAR